MKTKLFLLIATGLFLASCQKEQIVQPTHPSTGRVDTVQSGPRHSGSSVIKPAAVVTVSTDPNNVSDHVVQVSSSTTTQGITLGTFDIGVQHADATIPTVLVTINGAKSHTVFKTLRLVDASGILLDSESITDTSTNTVVFKNFVASGIKLPAGTTTVFTVKGDALPMNGAFVAGTSVSVSLTVLSSTATGPKVYFYTDGILVASAGKPTNTYSSPSGSQTHGTLTMTIPFSVTAFGKTAYIPSAASLVWAGSVNAPVAYTIPAIQYAVDNGSVLQKDGVTASITYTGTDKLSADSNGNYQIPVGQTKNFRLVITVIPSAPGSYRGQLVNVNYNTDDSNTSYSVYAEGVATNQFRTEYITGQ